MAPSSKISKAEWQSHEATIRNLYIVKNLTLDMLMNEMSSVHAFSTSHVPLKKLKKELSRYTAQASQPSNDITLPATPEGITIEPIDVRRDLTVTRFAEAEFFEAFGAELTSSTRSGPIFSNATAHTPQQITLNNSISVQASQLFPGLISPLQQTQSTNGLSAQEGLRLHLDNEGINDEYAPINDQAIRPQYPRRLNPAASRGDPNFHVDEDEAHRELAKECIQLMSASLKQDICGVDSPGKFVHDVESSRVQQCLPSEVQYACLYWVQHLQKSGAQLYDNDRFHQFLQEHFLHWLEALSWMRKMTEGIYEITSLESIALKSGCSRLHEYIQDMKRFASYSRPGIEQAPLQVYFSALIFAPTMSIVRKQFEDRIPRWIRRLPDVRKDWSALLQTLEGHSGLVFAVAFTPNSKQLASGSSDNTIRLWDASTGAALQTLEGHSDLVSEVAFSPDGKQLASRSDDGIVRLWDASTGAALQTLEHHCNWVETIAFSPDGKQLASAEGSSDGTVKLWDTGTGAALQTLIGHLKGVRAVTFSPDGKQLASASYDRTVRLWDTDTGAALLTLTGHSEEVSAVAFSPDGKQLASASYDGTVRLWDTDARVALQTHNAHLASIGAVAISPDALQTLDGYSPWTRATDVDLAFSPNGKQLASASYGEKTVKLCDAGTGAVLQTLKGHSREVKAVAFSPNGKQLASASRDDTVRLWDASTGAALRTLMGPSRSYSIYATNMALAFSPDGKQLASALDDETVRLWDTHTGAALQTLKGHSGKVRAIAFSPDGKQLASASDASDKTVKLWDTDMGVALQTLRGHFKRVDAVAFSPDGRQLASASGDKTVRLWDARTGAALHIIKMNVAIRTLSFSDDRKSLSTDRGLWPIISFSSSIVPSRQGPSRGIFVDEQWVTWRTENMLWLPPERRALCAAVRENVVALGSASGLLSIMEFAF